MKKIDRCIGCYNNMYNHGGLHGKNTKCFYFDDAKVIWAKEVHINDIPPYMQKKKRFLDCYKRPKYVYLKD